MIDHPRFTHVFADFSQSFFYALFALVAATVFHIDQALTYVLQGGTRETEAIAKRNILIFNSFMIFVATCYFGTFLWIFFTPKDILVDAVIEIEVGFRLLMLLVYGTTVAHLYRKLKLFPQNSMRQEVRSILIQFLSFFVGVSLEVSYEIFQIIHEDSTFYTAISNILVTVVSFVQPVFQMLYSHHKTFRNVSANQKKYFKHRVSQGSHRNNRIDGTVVGTLLPNREQIS